uniref:Uncharacterized protein n=1 Tax=Vitis vinifera TaxID=29760 RepID=A5BMW5_VITVI|nr:hypothetical protein VITISV_018471 [Vitis vinifera]
MGSREDCTSGLSAVYAPIKSGYCNTDLKVHTGIRDVAPPDPNIPREEKSIDSMKREKQRTRIERREIDGQIQVWEQISRFKKGVVTRNLAIGEKIMQPQFREGKKIQHGNIHVHNEQVFLVRITVDENEKFIGFIANSYEFRSEALQSPAVTVQNAVGPTPLRLLMLSQKPSLLGVPIKRYFSYFEPDADVKRRLLIMKQEKILIRGRKRHGLIGDQEIPGFRNGLVQILWLSVEIFWPELSIGQGLDSSPLGIQNFGMTKQSIHFSPFAAKAVLGEKRISAPDQLAMVIYLFLRILMEMDVLMLLKKQVKREPMSIQSLVPNETLNVHDGTKISDGIGTSSGQVERMPELVTLSTNLYSDRQCPGSLEMLANLHSSPFEPRNSDISSGMDDESNNYEMVNSGLEIPNAGDGHTLLASALVFLATEIHNLSERPVSNPSNRSRIS